MPKSFCYYDIRNYNKSTSHLFMDDQFILFPCSYSISIQNFTSAGKAHLCVGELLKNRKEEKERKAKMFSVAYLKTHIIMWLVLDMCLNFQHVFKFKGFAQLKLMRVRKAKPDLV